MPAPAPCSPASRCCACAWRRRGCSTPTASVALPVLPAVIGVVTSERGAVIQDIRTTIARRFPRTVLLWPVPVQGEGAAERIAAAIAGFERARARAPTC